MSLDCFTKLLSCSTYLCICCIFVIARPCLCTTLLTVDPPPPHLKVRSTQHSSLPPLTIKNWLLGTLPRPPPLFCSSAAAPVKSAGFGSENGESSGRVSDVENLKNIKRMIPPLCVFSAAVKSVRSRTHTCTHSNTHTLTLTFSHTREQVAELHKERKFYFKKNEQDFQHMKTKYCWKESSLGSVTVVASPLCGRKTDASSARLTVLK